ncbi:hypothetical protein [Streptomyces sp. GS7]|uniref:hypothetical protein n=1 Tax=Streptomyces sp. GS7 TaxID=2692234 RepID=UPI0013184CD2|nr:hypothetical protein [Streptomyces sp. GS7]QHC23605.1 hypothetical protein GR130_21745 [Streptomyces sp. GS7]
MNTATTRFRGRAGRRLAATVVATAALGLGATACGQGSGTTGAAGPSASAQPTSGSPSDKSNSQGHNGGKSTAAPSAARGSGTGGSTGGKPASTGGGVAHAGNHRTIVGTLNYLAPGKLIVKPQGGGTDQAFLISNATRILGAAAICSDSDGSVTIGRDGYGTSKCTVNQLETAAKTNSVTVRVTMNPKSGGAETVEEKYHP